MRLSIIGTRGIPAEHGGFETFAERLSIYLRDRGWDVTVYCQESGSGQPRCDQWDGVNRVIIPVKGDGARATMLFDWLTIRDVVQARRQPVLTLGYNTALFCLRLRMHGIANVINMDGLEWKRRKWKARERAWLWVNERAACLLGNHLIADHPEIAKHLESRTCARKITMIPYGADAVDSAPIEPVTTLGLMPGSYALLIARAEPENSILEVVEAFTRKRRGLKLVILGNYEPARNDYHRRVVAAANEEVMFVGAIYDRHTVEALRYHCLVYVHGHTVGGTNPSLVEALGSHSLIFAHDNRFNRWVAGLGAYYFRNEDQCAELFDGLVQNRIDVESAREASTMRHLEQFTWQTVLDAYYELLTRKLVKSS